MLALMNSRAAISALDAPSLASRAICSSCGVRSSAPGTARLRASFAGGAQFHPGTFGEGVHA